MDTPQKRRRESQRMLNLSGERSRRERPEDELERLNRELRAITSCHQTLMRAVDEPNLLTEICRNICAEAGYRMAWVGYVEDGAERSVRPIASAGHDFGYSDGAHIALADVERGRGPVGLAIRTGKVVWIQDCEFDPGMAPWRAEALKRGYRAAVALPLKDEAEGVFGALCIYSGERDAFTAEEVRLLERIAADLAFGVLALRQREARKRVEALLQANLRFFEAMDQVNQAIQETTDLEAMLGRVLELALALFGCDRAWLLYPCDPEAQGWSVLIERARLEFAAVSAGALDRKTPMTRDARDMHAALLAAPGAVAFAPGGERQIPATSRERYGVQSRLAMAIRPKTAKAYAFGLHQCGRARVWTDDDQRLFEAIGRRLEDALSSQLAHLELRERESQLGALFRTVPDVIWVKDIDGRYISCNPPFEGLFGLSQQEVVGRTDYELAPREMADQYRAGDLRAIETGEIQLEQFEAPAADGDARLFEVLKAPLRDGAGKTIGVVGVARDISERRKADEQSRIAATAFEAQEGIVILDANKRILRVNRAFAEMTGHAAEDVIGKTPQQIARDPRAGELLSNIADRVARDGFWRGEMPAQRASGEIFPAWATVATVRGLHGEATHYVVTMTDIGERKRAEQEIVNLAYYDRLTGLPNRRLLRDRLEQALVGSARSGRHGALLFIDLDNFKLLNETSGHEVGDQLLVEVARRLVACLGAAGGAARVGGDEFVALVEDLDDNPHEAAALAKKVGETILAALNAPYSLAGGVRHSSPSIGVAMFNGAGDSSEELLKQADIAMYEAKAAGRNALRFFDPDMQATLAARAEAEAALRLAIRERRFVLNYQPQVDRNGDWIGAEALLRWAHPERGLVAPGEFIPLAEETGLILPIGRWVLETACERLKVWSDDRRTRDLSLSVNVSARQFSQSDFVEQVAQTLRTTGAPAERLVLELTESVVLDDVAVAADKMSAIKELGVGFAIDDFGTGYSSLAYLTRLPLDQIKIDRSFVRNLPGSANDAAVAHTIITLAESLGLSVIAEGVETEAQRRFLERHGCPSFQGFLFGKPMPIDAFEAKLA
jgi:diguanylate cyclase (GGDEF)-like protein/PAS domain S-box-containing protein